MTDLTNPDTDADDIVRILNSASDRLLDRPRIDEPATADEILSLLTAPDGPVVVDPNYERARVMYVYGFSGEFHFDVASARRVLEAEMADHAANGWQTFSARMVAADLRSWAERFAADRARFES